MKDRKKEGTLPSLKIQSLPLFLIQPPESLSDDLTAVRDRNKRRRLVLVDKVTQLHRLASLHDGKNDRLLVVLVSTLRAVNRRTPVQLLRDKVADWLRIRADNREILAHVNILNYAVNYERLCEKSAQ